MASASEAEPFLIALFDLDGFKSYNDTFGHPAGDALLIRLARALTEIGRPYGHGLPDGWRRVLRPAPPARAGADDVILTAERALSEHGEGFSITCSHGSVTVPGDARDAGEALRLADQRMYASKNAGRASAGQQTTDVLVKVVRRALSGARRPHRRRNGADGARRGRRLGISGEELAVIQQAAALHDLGQGGRFPTRSSTSPGPLDEGEWQFIRQHTVIGERILTVAPALAPAAGLVRASHERIDGAGYPDGLAGEEIPLGARIVAVCDAFDAMTSSRAYRPSPLSVGAAIEQLRGGAGTQFDPHVVEVFIEVLQERSEKLPRAQKDRVQHLFGEPPGEGVLLARVVGAEQHRAAVQPSAPRRGRSAAAGAAPSSRAAPRPRRSRRGRRSPAGRQQRRARARGRGGSCRAPRRAACCAGGAQRTAAVM